MARQVAHGLQPSERLDEETPASPSTLLSAGLLKPHSAETWGELALLVLAGLCLGTTVALANWVPGDDALVPLILAAIVTGRWTARRRWSVWTQALAALDTGVLAALCFAAGGPWGIAELLVRWSAWMRVAFGAGTAHDPTIFLLYAGLLAWATTFFAAWWFAQGRNGLTGFVPALAMVSISVFYSEQGTPFLFAAVFCVLLLAALGDLQAWKRRWALRGVDYATDLELDTVLAAGGIAVALVLLGSFVPAFSVRAFVRWVQETLSRPAERVEVEAGRLLGGVRPPQRQGEESDPGGSDYLPRIHLLGGPPELERLEVFRVWAEGAIAPYWRGATYDVYSGRGWEMTMLTEEPVSGTLAVPLVPRSGSVVQRFALAAEQGGPLYALAEPVAVQTEAVALRRGPGDLAGLRVLSAVYTVTSQVAQPRPEDLRAAPTNYPPEVAARYLQLPDSLPRRVRVLAQEVTAGAVTSYDRAVRVERYLRGFPYSLDVEAPPGDRDVADYFLFDLGEGYCDYYATAFVVLARSVGIPARLAAGYAGGRADPTHGETVVMEVNAHSWPEVYFPGWGWVAFEPTGRQTDVLGPDQYVAMVDGSGRGRSGLTGYLIWAGVAVVALGVGAWGLWQSRGQGREPPDLPAAWRKLTEEGVRLDMPRRPGQTVLEYAAVVAEELARRAAAARWKRQRWQARAEQARRLLLAFALAYTHYLYGGGPAQAEATWAGLWWRMARLRWISLIPLLSRSDSRSG